MYKLMKRYVIAFLCFSFFFYLGGAFIALSFNLAEWDVMGRLIIFAAATITAYFAVDPYKR